MTLSRLAPPLLLALAPEGGAAAPPLTAEAAMDNYRQVFKPTAELDCPRGENGEEIVVCGRKREGPAPGRLPIAVAREPGERIAGEANYDGGGCISRCPQPVMVPLHKAPAFIGKVIERLKDR